MHGLPPDVDLLFLRGKTLLQVCFGVHDLILHFDGNVSVTVTSSISFGTTATGCERRQDFRNAAPALLKLLHASVTQAAGDDAGTLTIQFDDGSFLNIHDDSRHFESYVIKHDDRTIVV